MRLTPPRPGPPRRLLPLAAALLATVVVAAACADEGPPGETTGETATTTTMADTDDDGVPTDRDEGPPDLAVAVGLRPLELGLDSTIAASAVPGSRSMLVAERAGRIHEVVFDDGGAAADLVEGPLLDLTEEVGSTASERGLLGVAVSPDGTSMIASYTRADGDSQIDRFDLDGEPGALVVDRATRRPLLTIEQPYANHNGGHVTFGPDDMLYIGMGDGGSGGDPEGNAQDPTTLLGKMLRIDPLSDDIVPEDNPFADSPDGARPEIWLTGVRNPWRFSFDPETGDLWLADVGQNRWEEVNLLRADDGSGRGANLGWDLYEGTEPFRNPSPAPDPWSQPPFEEPVFTYGHDRGCSVTGGVVYRGEALPALQGAYLYADFCEAGVRGLSLGPDGAPQSSDLDGTDWRNIVGFAQSPQGEVLVISLSEGVAVLVPAG
jgi:glucose/arabinose dehydrogenase